MAERIAVIGGCAGGRLADNRIDANRSDPWPEPIEAIRKDGPALKGLAQEEFVGPRFKTMHLTEMQRLAQQRPIDVAMVAVKSCDTAQA